MKILLIYPYFLEDRLHVEEVSVVPIGLYYVAALLKQNGYDVETLNWYDINRTPQEIQQTLTEKKPDVIGFSILHANRWGGIDIARIAKRVLPGVKTVFGGIGATFLWHHILKHFNEIDFVVIGEGEFPFLSLVRCIEREDYEHLGEIKGIGCRDAGRIVRTKDSGLIEELDTLPNPARYFTYQHLSSSRGCPGRCTFCGSKRFWGPKVRFHSPYFLRFPKSEQAAPHIANCYRALGEIRSSSVGGAHHRPGDEVRRHAGERHPKRDWEGGIR